MPAFVPMIFVSISIVLYITYSPLDGWLIDTCNINDYNTATVMLVMKVIRSFDFMSFPFYNMAIS